MYDISGEVHDIFFVQNLASQPFIEDARGPDGVVDIRGVLEPYSYWVYSQMASWPPFDAAPLVAHADFGIYGGLAYLSAACWISSAGRHLGT